MHWPFSLFLLVFPAIVLTGELSDLELQVRQELKLINYPPKQVEQDPCWKGILDVAIIGAGMAGQTAAFALKKEGIDEICIFDQASEGKEGPWLTYARMKTLLSTKTQMGPACWVPSLTYESYHRSRFGDQSWEELSKVPTRNWGEYLLWFRAVLDLPVQNEWKLLHIEPEKSYFRLIFENQREVLARKVVFATGREGMGGHRVPSMVLSLPRECWSTANQPINFEVFKGKRIGILGAGPTAFDAGISAAQAGAETVILFCRRSHFEKRNKQRDLYFHPFYRDFYAMEEELHWDFMSHILDTGSFPPPAETIAQFEKTHALVEMDTSIFKMHWDGEIVLETSRGIYRFDHLINATGYEIDLRMNSLLAPFVDSITLWKSRKANGDPRLASFPYLGPHFEFLGSLPFLKDLYCFNYAAFMSHGTAAGDMPGISFGARRLAEGIATDLFLPNARKTFERWKEKPLW